MAASWGAGRGEFWRASAEETAARDSLGVRRLSGGADIEEVGGRLPAPECFYDMVGDACGHGSCSSSDPEAVARVMRWIDSG